MATILIADDVRTDAELMASVVRQMGHSAVLVEDGEQCLASVKTVRPELILMDVVMPKLDGFGACRKLRRDPETAAIPVIMVSSKDQDSDKFWAEKQGASAYVTKPFSPELLIDVIRRFLG